jgi:Peptidase family M49
MKRAPLAMTLLMLACQTATPPTEMHVEPDVAKRLAQLPRTVIDYDRSLLDDNEKQVVAKLIEASKAIDELYWRQVWEGNPDLRARLAKQGGPAYEYFIANKGPWDRLEENEPFIGTKKKPLGAAFYPEDMTKEEFEKYVAAHPDQKEQLEGLFTVVRRDGTNLVAVPYSAYYRDYLEQAAKAMREAAALTKDASLKRFLTTRADAFFTNDYRESDFAWMDLQGPIEVVIGPYEVYEDNLFNYKAAFESFVTVVDKPESEKLSAYAHALPEMERNLPEPDEYKVTTRGTESPIKVVQEIYTAGDARTAVQTSAFNLPNDELVREKKGSKKVLLKNVMAAKFQQSGKPIASRVLEPSLVPLVSFDAYFNHVLFHELSHGLGPGFLTLPGGERVEVRKPLKELYSAIEECKADVLGVWNVLFAQNRKMLTAFDERQLFATYAGLMFRSVRFGVGEAHGRGTAVQWNWLREKGAITPVAGGRFAVDFAKSRDAVRTLATQLLTIQATGDYNRAKALLDRYGTETEEMKRVTEMLSDIPVDITPVFPAAGEK